jgi:hypothetical protein
MVPFGNNSQFLCRFFRPPAVSGLPIAARPVKQTRIGRGTRLLARLFCAKSHEELGGGPLAKMQDFYSRPRLRLEEF